MVSSGSAHLGRGRRGAFSPLPYLRLRNRLWMLSVPLGINTLVVESPTNHRSRAAQHIHWGQFATVRMFLADSRMAGYEYPVTSIKKHATGSGNAGKPEMVRAALAHWPDMRLWSEDQVDACWLLDLFYSELA